MNWYTVYAEITEVVGDKTFYRLFSRKVDFSTDPLNMVLSSYVSSEKYPEEAAYQLAATEKLIGKFKDRYNIPLDIKSVITIPQDSSEYLMDLARSHPSSVILPAESFTSRLLLNGREEFIITREDFSPDKSYRLCATTVSSKKKSIAKYKNFKIYDLNGNIADSDLETKIVQEIKTLSFMNDKKTRKKKRKLEEVKNSSLKFKYLTREQAKLYIGQEVFLPYIPLSTASNISRMNTVLSMYKKKVGFTKLADDEKKKNVCDRLEAFLDENESVFEEIVNSTFPEDIRNLRHRNERKSALA